MNLFPGFRDASWRNPMGNNDSVDDKAAQPAESPKPACDSVAMNRALVASFWQVPEAQ
jgi:hypothetical protein